MNFLLTFVKSMIISVLLFVLFVSIIGPILAKNFNWQGDDPGALFGPEWIWSWGFALALISFFVSALFFENK